MAKIYYPHPDHHIICKVGGVLFSMITL